MCCPCSSTLLAVSSVLLRRLNKKKGNPLIDTVEEGCTFSSPFLPALSCSFEYLERLPILQWRRHCNCIASIWNSMEKAILQSALPPPKFSSLFTILFRVSSSSTPSSGVCLNSIFFYCPLGFFFLLFFFNSKFCLILSLSII